MKLHLDYETASALDLPKVGIWKYATHPSTRILLLGWALNEEPVRMWAPHKYPCPPELLDFILDPFVTKTAWNAVFERLIMKFVQKIDIPANEWRDSQALGRYYSLPGDLEHVGEILNIPMQYRKMSDGGRLIKKFSEPTIAAKTTLFGAEEPVFRDSNTDPEDWELFEKYCAGDVDSERYIENYLLQYGDMPESEWFNLVLDQDINDYGVPVHRPLVDSAKVLIDAEQLRLTETLARITSLQNPNSDTQVLGWCKERGYPFSKIGKNFVARALNGEGSITEECREVLQLRGLLAKSSVDKFLTIQEMLGDGDRLRHQLLFYGAPRTGRWSGKGVQLQNLTKPPKELEEEEVLIRAARLVEAKDVAGIYSSFKAPLLDVIGSCVRPSIQAGDGKHLDISDLSQIESIVVGYLSNCQRIIKVYTAPPPYNDAYKDFATEMFGKKYEDITKYERNLAKPPVLGCSYRLSAGEEITNDDGDKTLTGLRGYAANMGVTMTAEEATRAVKIFREKFPEIVKLWYALENAFASAVKGVPATAGKCRFSVTHNLLCVTLPSGRSLNYFDPKAVSQEMESKWGKPYTRTRLSFKGLGENHQWCEVETHGGKILENCSQAIARDVLMEGIRRGTNKGFKVVAHVHDEIVAETPDDSPLTYLDLERAMSDPILWAPDLPLKASGFRSKAYMKG